jgi:hypothetical protein
MGKADTGSGEGTGGDRGNGGEGIELFPVWEAYYNA